MSDDQKMTIVFDSEITGIEPFNSSFDKATIRIAYCGPNRNKSWIDESAFADAAPSLLNIPVVCNYIREQDNLGGHDVEVIKTETGIKMVNKTNPVGVVPESTNTYWEDVEEQDGTVRPYLHTTVLLWKRQEAYNYIKAHGICGQSMEIKIKDAAMKDDGYLHIHSFEYNALCLLGEGVTPCYESANLELFALDEFKAQLSEMMDDFKREMMAITASADGIDTIPKGGNSEMNLEELMEKYELSAEDIADIDVSGMDMAAVEELFAECKKRKQDYAAEADDADGQEPAPASEEPAGDEDPADEDDDDDEHPAPKKKFSLTANQMREELCRALAEMRWYDKNWHEDRSHYYYIDHDEEKCEVYCEDVQCGYMLCGMTYSVEGDKVVIDFNSCKRKKVVFADFEEGAPADAQVVFAAAADYDAKIQNLNAEIESLNNYKLEREAADFELAVAERVKKFADLSGNEVFDSLIAAEGHKDMTLDQIEEKCYAIRGRMQEQVTAQFALGAQKGTRLPVENIVPDDNSNEPYGGLFAQFGVGQDK